MRGSSSPGITSTALERQLVPIGEDDRYDWSRDELEELRAPIANVFDAETLRLRRACDPLPRPAIRGADTNEDLAAIGAAEKDMLKLMMQIENSRMSFRECKRLERNEKSAEELLAEVNRAKVFAPTTVAEKKVCLERQLKFDAWQEYMSDTGALKIECAKHLQDLRHQAASAHPPGPHFGEVSHRFAIHSP